jgi:glycerol-3-phosphate dehydrogenase
MTTGAPERDVAIIGGGLIGSAIARELSRTNLTVAIIEARQDIGDGTSKANTAILHTGFDAKPGTLESRLVAKGYHLLKEYAGRVNIGLKPVGAVLVAWTQEELDALPSLQEKAERNGYTKTRIVGPQDIYHQVRCLGPGALGGLRVPDESIICTWTTSLAMATEAVNCGSQVRFGAHVSGVEVGPESTTLTVGEERIRARWVINAAGLGGDLIDSMFGYDRIHLHPRRGELLVFDKLAAPLTDVIILPVPSKLGKGVLVSPTIYGNVMVGPTAEDMQDRSDTATTEAGFKFLIAKGKALMPRLMSEEVTTTYAGLRAAHDRDDYLIEIDVAQRYVIAGGIRSTGLTSCMAVAGYVRELLENAGVPIVDRADLPAPPHMPTLAEHERRPFADEEMIAADPAYGRLVCFCERVSEGEIRDTFNTPVPPRTLEGLRRRTRAMNGRCQGFFCGAKLQDMFDRGVTRED